MCIQTKVYANLVYTDLSVYRFRCIHTKVYTDFGVCRFSCISTTVYRLTITQTEVEIDLNVCRGYKLKCIQTEVYTDLELHRLSV